MCSMHIKYTASTKPLQPKPLLNIAYDRQQVDRCVNHMTEVIVISKTKKS